MLLPRPFILCKAPCCLLCSCCYSTKARPENIRIPLLSVHALGTNPVTPEHSLITWWDTARFQLLELVFLLLGFSQVDAQLQAALCVAPRGLLQGDQGREGEESCVCVGGEMCCPTLWPTDLEVGTTWPPPPPFSASHYSATSQNGLTPSPAPPLRFYQSHAMHLFKSRWPSITCSHPWEDKPSCPAAVCLASLVGTG